MKDNNPTMPLSHATYGIRSVRDLKKSSRIAHGPSPAVTLNKKKLYEYFLREVDPIISEVITHLLCSRPDDVLLEMLAFLRDKQESKTATAKFSNNSVTDKVSAVQRVFLATKISPLMSKIVNRIAVSQPKNVIEFIILELNAMLSYEGESELALDFREVGSNVKINDSAESLNAFNTESPSKHIRPTTAYHNRSDDFHSQEIKDSTGRPVTAPISSSSSSLFESLEDSRITIPLKEKVFPRVLQFGVLGLGGSGKTSFINALQGSYDMMHKVRPTIGFRPTTMMLDETLTIKFYDLGGGKKIRDIWSQVFDDF